uniref:Uncharacterized protein n=1 Tax=Brassica oleracea var. oleracea TaxID=109376 RepID=A0A0D2ZUK7_BRAOL
MEFLETFGYIWSSRKVIRVIFGRALPGATSRSDYMKSLANWPELHGEVARVSIARHPSQSDLPERRSEVACVSMAGRHKTKPGATSQSDPLRSLPKDGATCRSDMPSTAWSDFPERLHEVAVTHTPERPGQSDIERSLAFGSRDTPPRATWPELHGEVARISIARHPSQSDLPERRSEVTRVSMARRHKTKPGATSQRDPLRSLPKAGATCRSNMPRSLRVYLPVELMFF